MKVAGRVLIVTGAGSGMGREVALEALRRGAAVAGADLNPKTLSETQAMAAAGDRFSAHVVNVADRSAIEALPDAVTASHGVIDGLVHCAGIIQPFIKVKNLDYAVIDRVFAVNWWGTLYLTKTLLPILLARPEAHIVNVSSMGGFLPVPGQTVYGASKAAVKLFTEALYAECMGTNVHVTVVFPGAVATNISANSGVTIQVSPEQAQAQMRRITQADKAARTILDGMERDAFRVLIGSDARLMDRLYRLAPRRAVGIIAGQMKSLLGGQA